MKINWITFVSIGALLISCSGSKTEIESDLKQINNYLYIKVANCIGINSRDDYNKLIKSGFLKFESGDYVINSSMRGSTYISKLKHNGAVIGLDQDDSGYFGICSPLDVSIKSVEEKSVEDYKNIYWEFGIKDSTLFKRLFESGLVIVNDQDIENTALFSKFDGKYKLKMIDNRMLNINDTLDFYNDDYSKNIYNKDIESSLIDYYSLNIYNLSIKCAPGISPITMIALVKSESRGNYLTLSLNGARIKHQPTTESQAIEWVNYLDKNGYSFNVGLAQINIADIRKYKLNPDQLFNPCLNIKTAGDILAHLFMDAQINTKDPQLALRQALSAYHNHNLVTTKIDNKYVHDIISQMPESQYNVY